MESFTSYFCDWYCHCIRSENQKGKFWGFFVFCFFLSQCTGLLHLWIQRVSGAPEEEPLHPSSAWWGVSVGGGVLRPGGACCGNRCGLGALYPWLRTCWKCCWWHLKLRVAWVLMRLVWEPPYSCRLCNVRGSVFSSQWVNLKGFHITWQES